ncbi:MAG: 30S ribosome-binding factor RbfA [Pseudomonadota bacterium]
MARHHSSASKARPAKGPSQRQLRAGELIRHALVEILQREDLRDPALDGVAVTISEVRASPDLKQATAYCAKLGGDMAGGPDEARVIEALNRSGPKIRHLLGQKVDLKYTPEVRFRKDESFDEAQRIDDLLSRPEVRRDLSSD